MQSSGKALEWATLLTAAHFAAKLVGCHHAAIEGENKMIASYMIRTIKYFSIGLFLFVLSVYGFFTSSASSQVLFVISGVLGLANAFYAAYLTIQHSDRLRR